MFDEPVITINGKLLTKAQSMALRSAATSFHIECGEPRKRKRLGKIADGYRARLEEVLDLMLKGRT
jgi:hypothetical protein